MERLHKSVNRTVPKLNSATCWEPRQTSRFCCSFCWFVWLISVSLFPHFVCRSTNVSVTALESLRGTQSVPTTSESVFCVKICDVSYQCSHLWLLANEVQNIPQATSRTLQPSRQKNIIRNCHAFCQYRGEVGKFAATDKMFYNSTSLWSVRVTCAWKLALGARFWRTRFSSAKTYGDQRAQMAENTNSSVDSSLTQVSHNLLQAFCLLVSSILSWLPWNLHQLLLWFC